MLIPTTAITQTLGGWTEVVKLADESVTNNTTVQDDDELKFVTASGGVYEFEAVIIYASPAGGTTPDLKYAFNEDGTVRGALRVSGVSSADAAFVVSLLTDGSTGGGGTDTSNRAHLIHGTHRGGGGTLVFQWSQNTLSASATIVRAGSVLRYKRII